MVLNTCQYARCGRQFEFDIPRRYCPDRDCQGRAEHEATARAQGQVQCRYTDCRHIWRLRGKSRPSKCAGCGKREWYDPADGEAPSPTPPALIICQRCAGLRRSGRVVCSSCGAVGVDRYFAGLTEVQLARFMAFVLRRADTHPFLAHVATWLREHGTPLPDVPLPTLPPEAPVLAVEPTATPPPPSAPPSPTDEALRLLDEMPWTYEGIEKVPPTDDEGPEGAS